jgi:hypothetical protein
LQKIVTPCRSLTTEIALDSVAVLHRAILAKGVRSLTQRVRASNFDGIPVLEIRVSAPFHFYP